MTHAPMHIIRQEAIGEEPITLTMAKQYLRLSHDQEDTLLLGMITAVRQTAEIYTSRSWIKTRYTLRITLPYQEPILILPHKHIELENIDVHEKGRHVYSLLPDEYIFDVQNSSISSHKLSLRQGWILISYMVAPPTSHLAMLTQTMLQHIRMLYERGSNGLAETAQLQAWYQPLRTYTL